ncbi:MAG: TIGR02266 family protein [Deltaproteobacteria bacterium]|nr:TIGR02266 family protein [Deltaproteobacteria bacterium]
MRRIALVLPIRFAFETRVVQTTTREISTEGVFVRCLEAPASGTQVSLRLYLPGLTQAAEFVGVVRELESGAESGFWAEFIASGPEAKEKLHGLLYPKPRAPEPVPIGAVQPTRSSSVADERPVFPTVQRTHTPVPPMKAMTEPLAQPPSGPVLLAGDSNRRTFPRYRARFGVRFESVQDFVLEYAANISAGGVFVVTDHPPEMNAVITVSMELPGSREMVTCKAVVVHRVTPEIGRDRGVQAGAGVQFIDADDAFREKIDRAIAHILDKG